MERTPQSPTPEEMDYVPLNFSPEDHTPEGTNSLPESQLGQGVVNKVEGFAGRVEGFTQSFNNRIIGAANRINRFFERGVKARNDTTEWVSDTAEATKEKARATLRGIGRGALYGMNRTVAAGEAVRTTAIDTRDDIVEGVTRQVEKGQDAVENTRDRVKINLGRVPLFALGLTSQRTDRALEKATRKRREAEVRERNAAEKTEQVEAARQAQIARATEARARIEARQAKWISPEAEAA